MWKKKKEKPDVTSEEKKSCSPPGVRHSTKASCTKAWKFLSLLSICVHVIKEIFRCILRRSGRPTVAVYVLAEDFLVVFPHRASHDRGISCQAVKEICLISVPVKRISGVERRGSAPCIKV